MRKDILQYMSDSILMEKFFSIDPIIIKQAGLFESLNFGNLGSFVVDFVKDFIKSTFEPEKGLKGIITGLLNFIAQGAIFKANPLVWALMTLISKVLGVDIKSIISSIVDKVGSVLKSAGQISVDKINSIGKSVAGSISSSSDCDDMLYVLRAYVDDAESIKKRAFLVSLAITRSKGPKIPWLGEKGGNLLTRIFGGDFIRKIPKARLGFLLVGIITWVLKTALLGAGLLAGVGIAGGLAYKLVGGKKGFLGDEGEKTEKLKTEKLKVEEITEKEKANIEKTIYPAVEKATHQKVREKGILGPLLKPSGWGERHFINKGNNLWIIEIIDNINDIENLVLEWAFYVYPNLDIPLGEDVILNLPSFQRIVGELEDAYSSNSSNGLVMPRKYHSVKQVVDTFANDAVEEIINIMSSEIADKHTDRILYNMGNRYE